MLIQITKSTIITCLLSLMCTVAIAQSFETALVLNDAEIVEYNTNYSISVNAIKSIPDVETVYVNNIEYDSVRLSELQNYQSSNRGGYLSCLWYTTGAGALLGAVSGLAIPGYSKVPIIVGAGVGLLVALATC